MIPTTPVTPSLFLSLNSADADKHVNHVTDDARLPGDANHVCI